MTDRMDQMDQRLMAAARRWQESQPPPPPVPVDRLRERSSRPRRGTQVALSVAAAVVLVATGAVAIGHLGSSGTTGSPAAPQDHRVGHEHPGTVAWADLPAAHPHVRTTLPPRGGHPGRVVTPFDRLSATGTIRGKAAPGDVITFDAVLESSTDLSLDPCPDYTIAFGVGHSQTRQLNCAAVPYRDGQGRPYLPAFKHVRFEMRVTVPDEPGKQKVLWTLDGPQRLPGFYGLVRVTTPNER